MENQKNNRGVIALLIVIIVILSALCILLATETISFKSNDVDNNEINQDVNENNNKNDLENNNRKYLLKYFRMSDRNNSLEKAPKNIADSLMTEYRLEIILNSEREQEQLYNELIAKGYICRVLTL